MQIIKLNAIDSTNTYLKEILKTKSLEDNTIVWTLNQFAGRGQQEAKWESEPYKNLTFSILKRFENFHSEHHFILNMCISLSIFRALKKLEILSGREEVISLIEELAGGRLTMEDYPTDYNFIEELRRKINLKISR